jgi:hypothetical protein
VDQILKNFQQLDYLKEFLFNEKQLYLFNNISKRNLNYYEKREEINKFKLEKFEGIIESLKLDNSELTQKLLRKFE